MKKDKIFECQICEKETIHKYFGEQSLDSGAGKYSGHTMYYYNCENCGNTRVIRLSPEEKREFDNEKPNQLENILEIKRFK
jgi:hypothetical protein